MEEHLKSLEIPRGIWRPPEESCMYFSNAEILEYLVKPAKEYPEFDLRILDDKSNELTEDSEEEISAVVFDGMKEDLYVSFQKWAAVIYFCNEAFMFIDDKERQEICSCETYGEIVYERTLRDKSPKEILEMLLNLILFFRKVEVLSCREIDTGHRTKSDIRIYDYVVTLGSKELEPQTIQYGNITFLIQKAPA